MSASKDAASKADKVSIVVDSSGRITGAFKSTEYRPSKEGDEHVVTAGLTAVPGQSVLEVEVPATVADLNGSELLSRLAEQVSVKALIASSPTAGQADFGSSQALGSVVLFDGSRQATAGVWAGQGHGAVALSPNSRHVGGFGVVTAGSVP